MLEMKVLFVFYREFIKYNCRPHLLITSLHHVFFSLFKCACNNFCLHFSNTHHVLSYIRISTLQSFRIKCLSTCLKWSGLFSPRTLSAAAAVLA